MKPNVPSTTTPPHPHLLLPFANREAFLHSWNEHSELLFLPRITNILPGTQVAVEIAFAEPRLSMNARCFVKWRRLKPGPGMLPGSGLDFLPTEIGTRALLLAFANNQATTISQRLRRFPLRIPLVYHQSGASCRASTDNVSRGGAFVLVEGRLPQIGEMLTLQFETDNVQDDIELDARVVWHRSSDRPGVGVRFVSATEQSARSLSRILNKTQDLSLGPYETYRPTELPPESSGVRLS